MSKGFIKKLELESSKVLVSASQMYFDVLVGSRFKGNNAKGQEISNEIFLETSLPNTTENVKRIFALALCLKVSFLVMQKIQPNFKILLTY